MIKYAFDTTRESCGALCFCARLQNRDGYICAVLYIASLFYFSNFLGKLLNYKQETGQSCKEFTQLLLMFFWNLSEFFGQRLLNVKP
jgi:hypothetical protein